MIVPELSAQTKATLASFLPMAAALSNPVDLIASATPDQYAKGIETLLLASEIDALIILYMALTVTDTADIAHGIMAGIENGRNAGAKTKPVLIGWMAEGDMDRTFSSQTETIPAYHLPETPHSCSAKRRGTRNGDNSRSAWFPTLLI